MVISVEIDYPRNWTTKRLKYLFHYSLSSVDRHVHLEELPVDVCHYPDVYHKEKIRVSDPLPKGTCTEEELSKFSLRDGDILITKDSESPDDIGVPCLITGNRSNTVCGYHLGIIRPRTSVDPNYFFRFLQTDVVKKYFYGESSGITRYGLGKHQLKIYTFRFHRCENNSPFPVISIRKPNGLTLLSLRFREKSNSSKTIERP